MNLGRLSLAITVSFTLLTTSAPASEIGPQGVSPGAPDRLARIDGACPTFSWEAAPGTERYELVVYRLDAAALSATSSELNPDHEVLFTSISGRATGWTPEAGDCFLPGERYAWFIRTVTDTETGEGSEWSEPRFFEVAAAPTAGELAQAIEVIRRWEAAGAGGSPALLSVADADPDPDAVAVAVPDADMGAGSVAPKSVITGTAAIRGEQPDPTGETYGVVGTSASPDGAGIGAANTAGGPDLVLDGTVPAEFSETGVNRQSAVAQTFSFTNTGGGGLTLDIDGVSVVTAATDQDTVGSLTCGAGQLAKWNGATWVCAPDLDTDTLSGLTCTLWQIPKWNGSGWECNYDWDSLYSLGCGPGQIAKHNGSDWACAEDEEGSYTAGYGVRIVNGEVTLDPTLFSTQINGISTSNGVDPSIAIGPDGLPLISLVDGVADDLYVVHCEDPDCISYTSTSIDPAGDAGGPSSIAIGDDNLALISYQDTTGTPALKVAHCDNAACTSATTAVIDNINNVGLFNSIAIGENGFGYIAYYDYTTTDLKLARCENTTCSSVSLFYLDITDDSGQGVSLAIGSDGLGLMAYWRLSSTAELMIGHCNTAGCSSITSTVLDVDATYSHSANTSVVIGIDGLPLVAYHDDDELKAAHCDDVTCSTATITVLDDSGISSNEVSATIGADGLPIISSYNSVPPALKVTRCTNVACTESITRVVDTGIMNLGVENSIAFDNFGRAVVAFRRPGEGVFVAHLPLGY